MRWDDRKWKQMAGWLPFGSGGMAGAAGWSPEAEVHGTRV